MKKINKNIIFQKIDSKLVGFDIDRSFLFTFNETAEYIYKKVKSGIDEKKLVALMTKRYDVDEKTAQKDIKSIIALLKKNKILI
jgi:hypothetical protein